MESTITFVNGVYTIGFFDEGILYELSSSKNRNEAVELATNKLSSLIEGIKSHKEKKKIYCFSNGGTRNLIEGIALTEDGDVVAQHLSSNLMHMKYDLGIGSKDKHNDYNDHYGVDNWELVWVGPESKGTHEGLSAAREKYESKKSLI